MYNLFLQNLIIDTINLFCQQFSSACHVRFINFFELKDKKIPVKLPKGCEKMQEIFIGIQDTRHQGYVKHKLEDIFVIIMCAVISGLDELYQIVQFAQSKKNFSNKILE